MLKEREKNNQRAGVLICGAYGMSNAGDEAILEAVVGEMRAIDPEMPITVLSRTPKETAERYGVASLHMFDVPGFWKVMRRSALYINGGGSLIQDVTSTRSLWYYLYTLAAAKRRGCRVLMYGCGIGPVCRGLNRKLTRRVIDRYVDAVTLREESSLAELRSFGIEKPTVEVASDPALTLEKADDAAVEAKLRELGLDSAGEYLCFCLRDWEGFAEKAQLFANAADDAWDRCGLTPVFLSVNVKSDGAAAQKVAAQMHAPYVLVSEPMPAGLTIGVISRMKALVSLRLHGLIFAASQAVPVAGVSYDPKVSAFLDYIGQKNYTELSALTEERLKALIDTALEMPREELRAAAEHLRSMEARNGLAARRLLEKE